MTYRNRDCKPSGCISGRREERQCTDIYFCPPECPTFDITSVKNDKTHKTQMMVNFTMNKAEVYYGKWIDQEIKLQPINSDGSLMNKVDESYLVWTSTTGLRMNGTINRLRRGQKYHPLITFKYQILNSSAIEPYSHKCRQEPFTLTEWVCKNNETIAATTVCDGKEDCGDGSDEWPSLCLGDFRSRQYVFVGILSYVAIGFLSYLSGKGPKIV